jgi:HAE1 family hydrophobic/amphiphilic exporter-1
VSLARLSVDRPVLTAMVTLIVLVLGAVSLGRVQIDLLPKVELPTVTITTEYPGASPEVMEQRVTQIIEEIAATVPGVEDLTSTSTEGRSDVKVTFTWGTDVDTAAIDVASKIQAEIDELPEDVVRPRVNKFDVATFPVVVLGVSSSLDPVELTTLIDEQIRYRFAQIPGVAQVDPWGEYEREVRVELDPARVREFGVPLDRILDALRNANLDLPAGKIDEGNASVTIRAPAQFTDIEQIRDTIVAVHDGAPVRIRQIGEVNDTYQKRERMARVNGERGIRIGIRKQSDANTVEVAEAVLAEVEAVNADFPQVHIVPVINQGNFIERSIDNVASSVLYGGALAIVVLMLFLRNVGSTSIIGVSIPISLIATFSLIYFSGLTVNLMTLGGLALGVGMMVDNSIVVLENVYRRRHELGQEPREAAIAGTKEVAAPVLASTVTTLVIFLPLAFVRGVSGVLFRDLAIVIVFSLACSLVVSLTVVPMLAARFMKRVRMKVLDDATSGGALSEMYRAILQTALRHRIVTVVVAFGLLAASLPLIRFVGTEFMPPSDEGEVRVTGEMAVGTRLELVDKQTQRLEKLTYPEVPEAIASVVSVGASGQNPAEAFQGEVRITLPPATERDRSNTEVADALRRKLEAAVPGMTIRTRAPQGQFLLERVLGTVEGVIVEVRGFDLQVLDELAREVSDAIVDVPGITDVKVSREAGVPQQELRIDRDKAADLGLSPADVARAVETAVAGSQAGEYRVRGNAYRILVQLADVENVALSEILDMTVQNAAGEAIALRNVVATTPSRGPIVIERDDQQRLVKVTANVAGRDMGSVALEIEDRLDSIPHPVGYDFVIAGNFEEQRKAFDELVVSLVLSLVLVYMVLAAQYESLIDPLVVMMSVPVAGVGVLVALVGTHTTFNVQSFIGCIMLGGIVVNNAILLVDQANQLRAEGLDPIDAMTEAGRRRLRPILMTTLTTILGLLPLALGIGEGTDAQAPLARVVLGGLTASTIVTLVLIPAVYSLVHRK